MKYRFEYNQYKECAIATFISYTRIFVGIVGNFAIGTGLLLIIASIFGVIEGRQDISAFFIPILMLLAGLLVDLYAFKLSYTLERWIIERKQRRSRK